MYKTYKKLILCIVLVLIFSISALIILPKENASAKSSKFLYINKAGYTLTVLSGDINNPSTATVIYGPVSIAGPRKYFSSKSCKYPGGKGCTNYQNQNMVSDGVYSILKSKGNLKWYDGMPYSLPYDEFQNNDNSLKMYYPLLIQGTNVSGINIHTYRPESGFNPALAYQDSWGNTMAKGEYTHGCWALKFSQAAKVYSYAYDGMLVRFASTSYSKFNTTIKTKSVTEPLNTQVTVPTKIKAKPTSLPKPTITGKSVTPKPKKSLKAIQKSDK